MMTDNKFQKLLDHLAKTNREYKDTLNEAEEEYKRRFGKYPSDWDDDTWIDTYHVGAGNMTVEQVTKYANFCKR